MIRRLTERRLKRQANLLAEQINAEAHAQGSAEEIRFRLIVESFDDQDGKVDTFWLWRIEHYCNGQWLVRAEDVIGRTAGEAVSFLEAAREQQDKTRAMREAMVRWLQQAEQSATNKGENK